MKLTQTPCSQIRAGDKIDLCEGHSFYDVLRVRLIQDLFATDSLEDDGYVPRLMVEILVQHPRSAFFKFEPKYLRRDMDETITKIEPTEI